MSTVGINFGSATSGTGFDVTTTVNSILAIQQGIETPWKTQLTTLAAQDTAFTQIGTDLATLSTSLGALTAADGVMASKQGSSSDTNVLSLSSASTDAVAGSHTITVGLLAQTSSQYTNVLSSSDTLSGALTIQVGSGTAQTITLDSSDDTLSTLASAINQGSYGVTASVVTDTNGSRLSIVSGTSGAAGQLTLSSTLADSTTPATTIAFQTGQTGADAQLNVDGVAVTSASNTVSGVIPGVTFQILSAAPNEDVQVQITNDNSAIETAMQTFVTAYNAVATDIKTQEGKTSTGAAEPLYGDPTLALIQQQLSSGLFQGTGSGSIKSITDLGLEVSETGQLSLNVSTLETALNSNFTNVSTFLQGTEGFGQTYTSTLNGLGNTGTGAVDLALAQDSQEEGALNTDVTNQDALIATEKTTLTTELNTANEELQAIPEQLNEVNELYSSFTGYNTNTGS